MSQVTMRAPDGVNRFDTPNGQTFVANDRTISVDLLDISSALKIGFTLTNDSIAALAAIGLSKVAKLLADRVLNSPALAIGTANTKIGNGAFDFQIGAASAVVNTFKKKAAADATLPVGTVPADKYAGVLETIKADGTLTVTAAALNYSTGYATEALAYAAALALSAPANEAVVGVVTWKTAVGLAFVSRTDALAGGTGGNPASSTTYYNAGLNY